jgi:hypothetical protein
MFSKKNISYFLTIGSLLIILISFFMFYLIINSSADPWRAWIPPSLRAFGISINPGRGDAGYSRTDRFCLGWSLRKTLKKEEFQ